MKKDLTKGAVTKTMLWFAVPMILGNMLQQLYNIVDTWVVGRFIGSGALAAVGSAYTLMSFLTSVLIGLCMGSGAVFSIYYGRKEEGKLKSSILASFLMITVITICINVIAFAGLHPILRAMQVPGDIYAQMYLYMKWILAGLFFVFLYNYFSFLLRSLGNSSVPLWFLAVGTVVNIVLDFWFVAGLHLGVEGAAAATVIAQAAAGIGITIYCFAKEPYLRMQKSEIHIHKGLVKEIVISSAATSVQQSVMNFGILMVQGLVNSFGTAVMAAFAAGVKIDSFAYMPAQEFGNAFSIFIAQNHGAGEKGRIHKGIRSALAIVAAFCILISGIIFIFAGPLLQIFIHASETEIIRVGVQYLRIEGSCYIGIGILFLLYGYYRAIERPIMSVVLTVISLGTRVALAYIFAPVFGTAAIWWAIPIGWLLADVTGLVHYIRLKRRQ